MRRLSACLISLVICSAFAGKHDVYSGYTVHGVVLRDRSDQEFLHQLEGAYDLDVWHHGYPGETPARVMLAPEYRVQVLDQLDGEGITHYLDVVDVARALEKDDEELAQWRQTKSRDGKLVPFENYPRHDEVNAYLEKIAAEHPDIVELVDAGPSFDNLRIKYLKISSSNFNDASKPIYFMDAMIHAREWVTTPVALYSIHRLVEDLREEISSSNFNDASKPIYFMDAMIHAREWVTTPVTLYSIHRLVEDLREEISSSNFNDASKPIYFMDAMIHAREWVTTPVTLYSIHRLVEDLREEDSDLLRDIDWIILPVVNPDGYEYTHTDMRLWRRTRSFDATVSTTCYGVDANRNFDVNFNTTSGVSSNPCNDQFTGPAPFSERETRIVRDIMMEYLDRIQIYMNIHSHGNWILYGFGNTSLPTNAVPLHHVGAAMGAAMDTVKLPQAVHYRVGNSALLLYPTSGSAQDYGQEVGIPFSYTLELPGYGVAFQVPPQYIEHINQETWRGIAVTARLARAHYAQSRA